MRKKEGLIGGQMQLEEDDSVAVYISEDEDDNEQFSVEEDSSCE